MNPELKRTINYLKSKNKVLLLTTSNRSDRPKDKPKSTQLAEYIQQQLGEKKCEIIDVTKLKIYNCCGNVSDNDGNHCGLKDFILKNKKKNKSGYLRCSISRDAEDDQLWKITNPLFESDAVVFFGSIRWGQANAYYQKLIERLNWIENRWATLGEDNIIKDIEAGIILVGHNWNGHNVLRIQKQVLKFYGFEVPEELSWNWQYTRDELDETQEGYKRDPKVFENIFKVLQQLKESFKSWLIKK